MLQSFSLSRFYLSLLQGGHRFLREASVLDGLEGDRPLKTQCHCTFQCSCGASVEKLARERGQQQIDKNGWYVGMCTSCRRPAPSRRLRTQGSRSASSRNIFTAFRCHCLSLTCHCLPLPFIDQAARRECVRQPLLRPWPLFATTTGLGVRGVRRLQLPASCAL